MSFLRTSHNIMQGISRAALCGMLSGKRRMTKACHHLQRRVGHQAGAGQGGMQRRHHPIGILKEIARHHTQTWTMVGGTILKGPRTAQDHRPREMIGGVTNKDPRLIRGTLRAVTVQENGQRLPQGIHHLAKRRRNVMNG